MFVIVNMFCKLGMRCFCVTFAARQWTLLLPAAGATCDVLCVLSPDLL